MGKTRNKSGSEVEHLRGQLRSLKSENKALKQRLRQLEKREHFFEDFSPESVEIKEIKNTCTNCGKGDYKIIDLGRVVYQVCPICNDRKRV